jgi:hypothetical protein
MSGRIERPAAELSEHGSEHGSERGASEPRAHEEEPRTVGERVASALGEAADFVERSA